MWTLDTVTAGGTVAIPRKSCPRFGYPKNFNLAVDARFLRLLTISGRITGSRCNFLCQHPEVTPTPVPLLDQMAAATFRTPGRRQGGDTLNMGSPSLIPTARAHQHGTPGTPTTPHGTSSSEVGTNVSVSSDSRKRQSKKDEVHPPLFLNTD